VLRGFGAEDLQDKVTMSLHRMWPLSDEHPPIEEKRGGEARERREVREVREAREAEGEEG
jgi:hypothetical protein